MCIKDQIGDGFCDDANNIKDCNFDGLDCCLPEVKIDRCLDCICHLNQQRNPQVCTKTLIGDGKCTDACNNGHNFFDLNDCCGDYIEDIDCSQCLCHLDGLIHAKTNDCKGLFIGDGHCHDVCNEAFNNFDGGDCCLPLIEDAFCSDCFCFQDSSFHDKVSCRSTFIGNFKCNDECNFKDFNFDGLDCCLEIVDDTFCSDCICHQDGDKHPGELELGSVCSADKVANGVCNWSCNLARFEFDGHDCCLEFIMIHTHMAHGSESIYANNAYVKCHLDDTIHPSLFSQCKFASIGDGICNDQCNALQFHYDFGDCCLPLVDNSDCTNCTCHQDGRVKQSTFCPTQFLIGDGICDDGCNDSWNDFDGNDCCLDNIIDLRCSICICHLSGQVHQRFPDCQPSFLGDFLCHDACNVPEFEYDWMDCCREIIDGKSPCTDCICHLTGQKQPVHLCPKLFIGDSACDDVCNNVLNDFDGGDCCLPVVHYCSFCKCHADNLFHAVSICPISFRGDGQCEDACNLPQYDYDYDDCCLEQIHAGYCIECTCHRDGQVHYSFSRWCTPNDIGNGICNDYCNNDYTEYDDYDCCLDFVVGQ